MTEERGKKRGRDDEDEAAAAPAPAAPAAPAPAPDDGADDDDAPLVSNFRMSRAVRKGHECPYLDTICRQNLDFDFEKCCSVSLSRVNVYVCLVCGKNFSGRGPATHAYTHALEAGHHLFMNLDSGRAYCLPDMYEVQDRALADIQFVLNPTYTEEDVARLDASSSWSRALDGTDYMPGLVGLNNMRANDYANAVLQALARLHPVRDFFLRPANYAGCASLVVQRFGELVRRVWNPRAFKGHVSPHELMQAVLAASARRFAIEAQGDPVEFFSWLANTLHADLTGGRRRRRSVITDCLQGEMRVTTLAGTGKARGSEADLEETLPFLMVALDLPPAPLFKDALEEVAIPQVPVFELLRKFDGARVHDDVRAGRRRFAIARLPPFLVLHAKRFLKNQFFVEKNPTIVNFPVKGLDLGACVALPPGAPRAMYDLVANVVHEGKAGEGSYRVHVQRRSEGVWYEVQDLRVGEVLPQVVALSEAYLQVWERRPEAEAPPARAGARVSAGGLRRFGLLQQRPRGGHLCAQLVHRLAHIRRAQRGAGFGRSHRPAAAAAAAAARRRAHLALRALRHLVLDLPAGMIDMATRNERWRSKSVASCPDAEAAPEKGKQKSWRPPPPHLNARRSSASSLPASARASPTAAPSLSLTTSARARPTKKASSMLKLVSAAGGGGGSGG